MGSRAYAEAVARLIDPRCEYFYDRIVARDPMYYNQSNFNENERCVSVLFG